MTKTKRITSILLTLVLCLTLLSPAAFAKVADPPKSNGTLDAITVSVPYFPGLEITMTNVPYLCVDDSFYEGMLNQVKFYYGKNTTISFNQDVTMGTSQVGNVKLSAGEAVKSSALAAGSMTTKVIANTDGSFSLSNSSNITLKEGQKVYDLAFVDVTYYAKNIAEGNAFEDIRNWAVFKLGSLESAVATMEKEWTEQGKLDTSRLTSVNSQLSYLNRELAAGKKPADLDGVKAAIADIETIIANSQTKEFALYVNGKVASADGDWDTLNTKVETLNGSIAKAKKAIG